jgi:hypothetical protein
MKLNFSFKRKVDKIEYKAFTKGKYAGVPIPELDTHYIAHSLEEFILEDGMRAVLAKELVKRCKIEKFV